MLDRRLGEAEYLARPGDYAEAVHARRRLDPRLHPIERRDRDAREGPHAPIVNEVVLRTQMQAIYSTENVGHFGLHLDRYAHFTSPIRRYADLIVHRALIRALKLGRDGLTQEEEVALPETGEHISMTERRSMMAERDTTDRYLAAYLADRGLAPRATEAEIEAVGEVSAAVDADGGGAGACRLADEARDAGAAADLAEADAVGAEQRPVLADGAADGLACGLMTGVLPGGPGCGAGRGDGDRGGGDPVAGCESCKTCRQGKSG